MKTAIVHYWLTGMGGGERVLEALCRIWPDADIFTHAVKPGAISPFLEARPIKTSFINSLPLAHKLYKIYLPLMPLALEQLDLRNYDLVISSESGPAKGVLTRADTAHICYCHSPMRYLWDFYQEYLATSSFPARFFMRPFFHYLRMWDALCASRVDAFAANSAYVAARVRKHWRREATVIHPPAEVERVEAAANSPLIEKLRAEYGSFFLFAGRLVPYKRADLAIRACARLGHTLVLAGSGPEQASLEKLAKELGVSRRTHFLGFVPEERLYALYHACEALLFPGEEDFGLIPVECMAAGRPVIAYGRGGALETVKENSSGLFFSPQDEVALSRAIENYAAQKNAFTPAQIREQARQFTEAHFSEAFLKLANTTFDAVRSFIKPH